MAYLTVQLEFGQRLAASAGGGDYGSLSCFVQYYADVKVLFKINAGSFHPRPKVDSCFVSLTMKPKPDLAAQNEQQLFKMIQTAFQQRRKTIANALKGTVEQETLLKRFEQAGIDPQWRPEEISLLKFVKLSNSLVI